MAFSSSYDFLHKDLNRALSIPRSDRTESSEREHRVLPSSYDRENSKITRMQWNVSTQLTLKEKRKKSLNVTRVRYASPTKHLSPKYEVDEVKVANHNCPVLKLDFNC